MIALFEFAIFSYYYVKFGPALCPFCVTYTFDESTNTGGLRCISSNKFASDSKHTIFSYHDQQMAVFNYFYHLSILPLSYSPPSPYHIHFYPFFLQVLRNRDFQSGSFSAQSTSLRHLLWFYTISEMESSDATEF